MRKFPLIITIFKENYQNGIKIKSNNTTKNKNTFEISLSFCLFLTMDKFKESHKESISYFPEIISVWWKFWKKKLHSYHLFKRETIGKCKLDGITNPKVIYLW